MSRAKRVRNAQRYNIFLIVLIVGIPALFIIGTQLDRERLVYGVTAAILVFIILFAYAAYTNWLGRKN